MFLVIQPYSLLGSFPCHPKLNKVKIKTLKKKERIIRCSVQKSYKILDRPYLIFSSKNLKHSHFLALTQYMPYFCRTLLNHSNVTVLGLVTVVTPVTSWLTTVVPSRVSMAVIVLQPSELTTVLVQMVSLN